MGALKHFGSTMSVSSDDSRSRSCFCSPHSPFDPTVYSDDAQAEQALPFPKCSFYGRCPTPSASPHAADVFTAPSTPRHRIRPDPDAVWSLHQEWTAMWFEDTRAQEQAHEEREMLWLLAEDVRFWELSSI